MKKIDYKSVNFKSTLAKLYARPSYPPEIEESVRCIIEDVRKNGDKALVKYAEKFDHAVISHDKIRLTQKEIDKAADALSTESRNAIREAFQNIQDFSKHGIPQDWNFSPREGVVLGERYEVMDRIGVYIPGGSAPLVSTVLHTAGVARAAGVKEIAAVTPPGKDGQIHPAVIYALDLCGVTDIYRLGGVYGIAALAYGTHSVKKVEKIVGPGNAYVTAAKKIVYGQVAIDMVAGPSEIMIIADSSAKPDFIAADMLSQAEHGSGLEQAVLVCTDKDIVDAVAVSLKKQAKTLGRLSFVEKVLKNGVFLIHVEDIEQAIEIAGKYAPEHLEIMCRKAKTVASKIRAAGAIFIGEWTPEPVGDFTAGPSHVLPTAGSARYFHGLTVSGFFRRMSTLQYTKDALISELPAIHEFSRMEGLDAHGRSALIRADNIN